MATDGNTFLILILDKGVPPNIPIAKWKNTLHVMLANKFLASKDDGKTWNLVNLCQTDFMSYRLDTNRAGFYAAFDREFSVLKITVKRGRQ